MAIREQAWLCALLLGCAASPPQRVEDRAEVDAVGAMDPAADPSGERGMLELLPRGAPVYLRMRPSALAPLTKTRAGLFARGMLGVDPSEALERAGADPAEPVALAVQMDEARAERAVSAVRARLEAGAALAEALEAAGPLPAMGVRLVLRLKSLAGLEKLAAALDGFERFERCPARACEGVEGAAAVARGGGWRAAFRQRGELAVVDLVFGDALGEAVEGSGGPDPSLAACRRLDPRAALALCVDPERVARLGAAQGRIATLKALSSLGSSLSPPRLLEILAAGEQESDAARDLARRGKPWVRDLALALSVKEGTLQMRARWTLSEPMRALWSKAHRGPQRAGSASELRWRVLDPLHRVLAGEPALAADAAGTLRKVQEAGWAGIAVAASSAWPVVLAAPDYQRIAQLVDRASAHVGAFDLDVALERDALAAELRMPLPNDAR